MPNTYNKEEVMKEFDEKFECTDIKDPIDAEEQLLEIRDFIRTALTLAEQAGEERMYRAGGEACKKVYQNHKENHLCRFNDGEQNCNCYLSGMNEIIVALEELK